MTPPSARAWSFTLGGEPDPSQTVFGAMAFVCDDAGHFAVVFSPKRGEWGSPGGHVEPGESPEYAVLREIREETGLEVRPSQLTAYGYETFGGRAAAKVDGEPAYAHELHGVLRIYGARIDATQPAMRAQCADAEDPMWVSWEGFRELCGELFWWPVAEAIFGADIAPGQ